MLMVPIGIKEYNVTLVIYMVSYYFVSFSITCNNSTSYFLWREGQACPAAGMSSRVCATGHI